MKKKYVLFDLDGTLTDSQPGIINAILYALKAYGITVEDKDTLRPFLGPPLTDSFETYFGFDRRTALEAVEIFREYYNEKGKFENRVYPGVPGMLDKLREEGFCLFVATSKPETTAREILEHFDLASRFGFIGGATMSEDRVKKADVIRYVLEENAIRERSEVVMVGDRSHDVLGAKENGIACVGVLYGYGDRRELEDAGACCLAETAEDIVRIISPG